MIDIVLNIIMILCLINMLGIGYALYRFIQTLENEHEEPYQEGYDDGFETGLTINIKAMEDEK